MDTQLLKTFLEIYRTRHFGQAAHNLHLSQSAVSARIRLLEEELGVSLFTRERNNIQLTAAGEKLLPHAENITTSWGRVRQEMAMGENGSALLSVAAVPSLWDIALQDWAQRVYSDCPEVGLSAEAHDTETLLRNLLAGSLDLAFLFDAPRAAQLKVVEALPVSLIMVSSSPGLSVEEALSGDYVMVDWGTSFAISHAQQFAEMPRPRARVGLGRMAKALLLARGGSAYLAEAMVREQLRAGHLHRVEGAPAIERMACAVYRLQSSHGKIIDKILPWLAPRPSSSA